MGKVKISNKQETATDVYNDFIWLVNPHHVGLHRTEKIKMEHFSFSENILVEMRQVFSFKIDNKTVLLLLAIVTKFHNVISDDKQ